jgi:hypothetical protein
VLVAAVIMAMAMAIAMVTRDAQVDNEGKGADVRAGTLSGRNVVAVERSVCQLCGGR